MVIRSLFHAKLLGSGQKTRSLQLLLVVDVFVLVDPSIDSNSWFLFKYPLR